MKQEELDKATYLASYKRYTQKSTSVAFENGAKFGAEWVMKQPLSERLTDAEKEDIVKMYKFHYTKSKQGSLNNNDSYVVTTLEAIFGEKFFWSK